MSDARHTPGPWCASNGKLVRVSTGTRPPITICGVHRVGDRGGAQQCDPLANARLIAAAPEMLEALEGIVRVADRATPEFDAARAAIAKAKGEAQ